MTRTIVRTATPLVPFLLAAVTATTIAACGGDADPDSDASSPDVGGDTAIEPGDAADTGGDAARDTGPDAVPDAPGDVATDPTADSGPDTSEDGGTVDAADDAGRDVGDDAADDAAGDAASDRDAEADTTIDPPSGANAAIVAWYPGTGPDFGQVLASVSGDTSFGPFTRWLVGADGAVVPRPDIALIADLDGDGNDDLVSVFVASRGGFGSISASLGDGESFGPFTTWLTGTEAAPVFGGIRMLAGDIDGDGRDEVLAFGAFAPPNFGSVTVYRNTGVGFEPGASYSTCSDASPCQTGDAQWLGDVDGDRRDDLVTLFAAAPPGSWGGVRVRISTGATFGAGSSWFDGTSESPVFAGASSTHLVDVDGDRRADLVFHSGATGGGQWGSIHVMTSTGSAFNARDAWLVGTASEPVRAGSSTRLAGDVNGDGRADVIAWSGADRSGFRGGIDVHLSTGTSFGAATQWLQGTDAAAVPNDAFSWQFARIARSDD